MEQFKKVWKMGENWGGGVGGLEGEVNKPLSITLNISIHFLLVFIFSPAVKNYNHAVYTVLHLVFITVL